jgi:hypothetical protein
VVGSFLLVGSAQEQSQLQESYPSTVNAPLRVTWSCELTAELF